MESSLDLNRNISEYRFIAFDTETTGVSYADDYVVELAGISFDEDFEHRRFSSLVRPPISIPEVVRKIHGIDDLTVADAPPASQVIGQFFSFLEFSGSPRILLAHNAAFDIGMLLGECKRAGLDFAPEVVIDTCMLAKALLPDLEKHKLSALAEYFKISSDGFHRAMQDVLVLKEVFLKLLGLASDKVATAENGLTLAMLLDLSGGYFVMQKKIHLSSQKKLGENFYLPPKLKFLEEMCGTEKQVGICYEKEEDYRYVTPLRLEWKSFRVYMEAFCHRDQMKKRFRLDKVLKIGKVLGLLGLLSVGVSSKLLAKDIIGYTTQPRKKAGLTQSANNPTAATPSTAAATPNTVEATPGAAATPSPPPGARKVTYHILDCQGRFGDPECRAEIYFGACKEKITMEWLPAQMKPSPEWKDKNRNFCKVVLTSTTHETPVTVGPDSCKELFRYFSNAGQVFPEAKWLDHPCRNASEVVSQTSSILKITETGKDGPKETTWERSVRVDEVLKCRLKLASQKNKAHKLECPVLLYSIAQWLEGFLTVLGAELQVRNELK